MSQLLHPMEFLGVNTQALDFRTEAWHLTQLSGSSSSLRVAQLQHTEYKLQFIKILQERYGTL